MSDFDLEQPLLDVASLPMDSDGEQHFTTEYEDMTDTDIPSMQPHYRKRRRGRRTRTTIRTTQSSRIYSTCLGKQINTDLLTTVLQHTGWVVRSQPYGCVYCIRQLPDSPKSTPRTVERKEAPSSLPPTPTNRRTPSLATLTTQHIFLFDFGCLVCWGCTEEEERSIVTRVLHTVEGAVGSPEEDDMTFIYSSASQRWKSDEVSLSSSSPIEKFAISLAFAQSVKLKVYEENVYKVIEESRPFPEALAQTGEISITQRHVSQKIGELFCVRYQIFLESEMLETPKFFWESDEWEPTYVKARKYLDIGKRMDVLKDRLDIVKELLDMLGTALDNEHANRLEWIIVVLIVAEVVCQILFGIVDFKCWQICPGLS